MEIMATQQESSEAVERCIKALRRLHKWAIGGDCSVDPVQAIKYLLETYADAYSLATDWHLWAAVLPNVETYAGVTGESTHETALALVQRALNAVANDLGTNVLGPYPDHSDGRGRWTATIRGLSSVGRKQQELRATLKAVLDFDAQRLLAQVRKERALAADKATTAPLPASITVKQISVAVSPALADPAVADPAGQSKRQPAAEVTTNAGMSRQEAVERLIRLRQQGEPWTSYGKIAKNFGCSSCTIHRAVRETPSLQGWANVRSTKASLPKAQSLNEVVTDRTAQSVEPDPAEDAAEREFLETADPQTRAWFLGLSRDDQLAYLNDPDKYLRILGRKP
jgi:hypothetical protein